MEKLRSYTVWDAGTRWFHWINVLCVSALAVVGFVILNAAAIELPNAGKVTLKTIHVWIGYLFALNLLWRFVWVFFGNRHAGWRSLLPGGRGYVKALRSYVAAFVAGRPEQYVGHNPAGKLGIAAMFLLLALMAFTGLILAATDLFYPPFGHWIAQWVAAPEVAAGSLKPYAPEMYNTAAYESMRALRKPVALLHLYSFYALLVIVVLHVAAVIVTEIKERGGNISAMFTGRKVMRGRPVDEEEHSKPD